VLLTRKSGLQSIWPTRKAGLWKIRPTRKVELQKILLKWKAKVELQKILLKWKAGLRKIQKTQKARLWKIRLTRKTGLYRTRGARNQKNEEVLLQAKGQLHSGSQGVLPRHKNANCKRCVRESWPRKKKRKSRTIGLTVYGP
jgi:hypothetical protein